MQIQDFNSIIKNINLQRRKILKSFYGGIFIEKTKLKEAGKEYPIKLEYYKRINEDEILRKEKAKFGISIVKTEYIPNNTKIEAEEIKYLSNDESKIDNMLKLFKKNEVTPVELEDVVFDLRNQIF